MIKSCQKQLVAMVSRATETLYTRSCQCRLSQSLTRQHRHEIPARRDGVRARANYEASQA